MKIVTVDLVVVSLMFSALEPFHIATIWYIATFAIADLRHKCPQVALALVAPRYAVLKRSSFEGFHSLSCIQNLTPESVGTLATIMSFTVALRFHILNAVYSRMGHAQRHTHTLSHHERGGILQFV